MKIEKISDNQIRCRLTQEDLAERQIRLSELAYGSEKARALFRDMVMQAHEEYGFTNDLNIPLMIEAIPDSANSLTLIITKVEDPEELDTRFAKFSPTEEVADDQSAPPVEGADDILDVFHRLLEAKAAGIRKKLPEGDRGAGEAGKDAVLAKGGAGAKGPEALPQKKGGKQRASGGALLKGTSVSLTRAFRFSMIDHAIAAADALSHFYKGKSALYHLPRTGEYMLIVHKGASPENFNRVCNILSEYGSGEPCGATLENFLREHGRVVIAKNAVSKLASLLKGRGEE